jgi:catechol 2,3-dioxygenase-like lactoylglutathione lyase family enzyme
MKKILAAVALIAIASTAKAQDGLIVGAGNFFSPIVGDLDRAVAFYRDGIGLDVQGTPANAEQNPALRDMFGLPDAQLRWMVARPAGMRTGVEIVEIKRAEGKPLERRMQDPGAFTLVLLVRELDPIVARLKMAGAPVVTTGGVPVDVPFGGKARGVVMKDPDGHFVELVQPPSTEAAPAGAPNVTGVRVRLTVEDAGQTMRLYQQLGLAGTMNVMYESSAPVVKMLGLKGDAQYRYAILDVPGGLKLEFIDFKGSDRRTVRGNLQDPGSTRIQLQVRDVDAAIEILKAAGGVVVSTGGNTVQLPGRGGATTKVAIVRDPNNLFLVLIQAAPARNP